MTKNEAMRYAESIRDDITRLYNESPDMRDEEQDLTAYIFEALDVEYLLNSNRELIGVNLFVTLGGPTCWVDTRHGAIECRWGTESGSAWLASEICDFINDHFAECLEF